MATYEIYDCELNKFTKVEAPGIVEAITEYLPWPIAEIVCAYKPASGVAVVIDQKTDFKYDIKPI